MRVLSDTGLAAGLLGQFGSQLLRPLQQILDLPGVQLPDDFFVHSQRNEAFALNRQATTTLARLLFRPGQRLLVVCSSGTHCFLQSQIASRDKKRRSMLKRPLGIKHLLTACYRFAPRGIPCYVAA